MGTQIGFLVAFARFQMTGESHSATITIRRTSQYGNKLRKFTVWANNQQIGAIADGETAQFALPPGQHSVFLKIDWCKSDMLTLTLGPGDDVPLICGSDIIGWKNLLAILYLFSGNWIYLRQESSVE